MTLQPGSYAMPAVYPTTASPVTSHTPGWPHWNHWRRASRANRPGKTNGTDLPGYRPPVKRRIILLANLNAPWLRSVNPSSPTPALPTKQRSIRFEFALNLDFLPPNPLRGSNALPHLVKLLPLPYSTGRNRMAIKCKQSVCGTGGPWLWKPTAPAFAAPATPYWGNNRTVIIGSISNAEPQAPMTYSTDPASPFYQAVKQVYDVSQTLIDDQKAMARSGVMYRRFFTRSLVKHPAAGYPYPEIIACRCCVVLCAHRSRCQRRPDQLLPVEVPVFCGTSHYLYP